MARWTASAKWAAGPALDGQRDMPLALRLSEGLDLTAPHSTKCSRQDVIQLFQHVRHERLKVLDSVAESFHNQNRDGKRLQILLKFQATIHCQEYIEFRGRQCQ